MTTTTELEARNAAPRQDNQDPALFGQGVSVAGNGDSVLPGDLPQGVAVDGDAVEQRGHLGEALGIGEHLPDGGAGDGHVAAGHVSGLEAGHGGAVPVDAPRSCAGATPAQTRCRRRNT